METRNTELRTSLEYILYSVTVVLAGRRGLPIVDAWVRVVAMLLIVIEVVQEQLELMGMVDVAGTNTTDDIDGNVAVEIASASAVDVHVETRTPRPSSTISDSGVEWIGAREESVNANCKVGSRLTTRYIAQNLPLNTRTLMRKPKNLNLRTLHNDSRSSGSVQRV